MYRSFLANAFIALILAIGAVGVAILWGKAEFEKPGPLAETVMVPVEQGDRLQTVTDRLVAAGAVSNPTIFRLGARYTGQEQALKFADYEIPAGASMADVLDIITSGQGVSYQVTIPEGFTSWQVVERLRAVRDLSGRIDTVPPEGSLAPNTYAYSRGQDRNELIAEMTEAQTAILDEAWLVRDPTTPLESREAALILASIIEKETGVSSERAKVASVFVNRLNRGMRLQTDPTVIYGITLGKGSLGRGLRRSELDEPTPYNTYQIDGLPPTPIANPGKAAIEAALNPDVTDFVYFVADGTGGHAFARTLDEHNSNVAKWRQIEAERAAAAEAAAAEAENGDGESTGN